MGQDNERINNMQPMGNMTMQVYVVVTTGYHIFLIPASAPFR